MPFIKAVLTDLKHYGGSLRAPSVSEPSKAVLEVPPQPRRSARLNTEVYKLDAEARQCYLNYEDAQLGAYLKSEAFKRSMAKNRLRREQERPYWSHPFAIAVRLAEVKANQQLVKDCTTADPDSSVYRKLVQECIRLSAIEYQRTVAECKPGDWRIDYTRNRLFKWDDELKLLNGERD